MAMNVATSKAQSDSWAWVDNVDLGKLFIRVNLGFLLLWHGQNFIQGNTNQIANLGLIGIPAFIGWPAGVICEIVAPILAILGVYSRLAGGAMAIFMLFAIGLRHIGLFGADNHLFMGEANAQGFIDAYFLERQFFFLWSAVALFFMGAGKYGLNIGGRWNN
jgi:putative oxidoreductase